MKNLIKLIPFIGLCVSHPNELNIRFVLYHIFTSAVISLTISIYLCLNGYI